MQSQCHSIQEVNAKLQDTRYEVIQALGAGAMACVYLAKERQSGHLYAFKVLHARYRASEKHRNIFRNEAETMQRFQHPNIVRFYKYIEEETYVYIRMDYVNGITLYDVLQQAKNTQTYIPYEDVLRIIRQAGQGLDYLHHEGQLHLDIKPANILIQPDEGRVFLTDLGLTMDSGGVRTYVAGTPYYMPYEQQQGNSSVTTSADVYALAIMAYEMLTLRRPFEVDQKNTNAREQLKQAHQLNPVPPVTEFRKDLPAELVSVFEKALAKSPDQRYSVTAFTDALQKALKPALSMAVEDLQAGKAFAFYEDTPSTPAPRRNSMPFVAALLIIIGLISIGLFIYLQNEPSQVPLIIAQATEESDSITPLSAQSEEESAMLAPTATDHALPTDNALRDSSEPEKNVANPTEEPLVPSPTNLATLDIVTTTTISITAEATVQTPETEQVPTEYSEADQSTATPVPPTETPLPTETFTPTPTFTPTSTPTDLPPTFTPTAIPTAFLSDEPLLLLAEGPEVIGVGETLNRALAIFQSEGHHIIPLRSGTVNGFYSTLTLKNPSEFEEYGLVYRYQSESDFWLFRVQPQMQQWQIIAMQDGMERIQDSGRLDSLPERIAIAGKDHFFRFEMGDSFVQLEQLDVAEGSLALWLKANGPNAGIEQVQFALLGDEAVLASENLPSLPPPALSPKTFLRDDLSNLLGTVNIAGQVTCSDFTHLYDQLERHLVYSEVRQPTTDAQTYSSFIYNRCRTTGTTSLIDLNDSYVDFLMWQTNIQALIDILSS
jgi:serine/threonine protein kinase